MIKRFLIVSSVLLLVISLQNLSVATPYLTLPGQLVQAKFDYKGTNCYWDITLSGVGSGMSVDNLTYHGWCIDVDLTLFNNNTYWVYLVETYDDDLFKSINDKHWDTSGFMPNFNRGNTWSDVNTPSGRDENSDVSSYGALDKVNWILNNWQTFDANGTEVGGDIDWEEAQTAIWYYCDGVHSPEWTWNNDTKALVNAAVDEYVTPYGGMEGVILYVPQQDANQTNAPDFDLANGGMGQYTLIPVERPVPEPGTLILLGSGLAGLAGYGKLRLRRRRI